MPRDDDVFEQALALPPAVRAMFLERACGDDAALRARVDALLGGHSLAAKFFEAPVTVRAALTPEEKPSDRIGRYKLLEKIGEGGCGTVWIAQQEEPVRRRVALKVIKLGMDTKEVIARFEAERQALAMMDHPNIAKVFDAGTTHTGRPFFVMEVVRGVPITRYCDEANLPTAARLKLFIDVCHAIQHAHQKGIIHRDIKPSNILVAQHDDIAVPNTLAFSNDGGHLATFGAAELRLWKTADWSSEILPITGPGTVPSRATSTRPPRAKTKGPPGPASGGAGSHVAVDQRRRPVV